MTTNELIEQALGIPVQKSPVYTAKTLLRDCYKDKPQVIRDTTFDLRDIPFKGSALDLLFRRDLEGFMVGMHIHVYDKSSAYLAACSNTNTGIGDPVHLTEDITPGLPGIYRVTYTSPWPGTYIPVIEPTQEWITNDVLEYAMKHDYEVHIHEAWVFPNYDKVLGNRVDRRNWARRLWNAMQAVKPLDREAYDYLKVVSHTGLGGFATGQDKYGGINLIHPNWFFDVVGKARVNMFFNIEKLAGNAILIRVKTDELTYVSRDANPRTAIPGIFDRVGQLGGYKHVCSVQVTQELYEKSAGMTASELGKLIKDVAGLQEQDGEE